MRRWFEGSGSYRKTSQSTSAARMISRTASVIPSTNAQVLNSSMVALLACRKGEIIRPCTRREAQQWAILWLSHRHSRPRNQLPVVRAEATAHADAWFGPPPPIRELAIGILASPQGRWSVDALCPAKIGASTRFSDADRDRRQAQKVE